MIIFNSFICDENFNSVCSSRAEISARFTVMKSFPIFVILLLLSLSMRDEILSSRFNNLKFQPWLKLSTIQSAPKMEFLTKIFSYACKGSILDLSLCSECACAVCVIIICLQTFPLNFFCYLLICGDSKLFVFQLFRSSMKHMKLIHLHYNWQQNRVGKKMGDIFQSVRP